MDTQKMVSDLKAERSRIDRAIQILEGLDELEASTNGNGFHAAPVQANGNGVKKRTMSAAARKRISIAAKRRWREQKQAQRAMAGKK